MMRYSDMKKIRFEETASPLVEDDELTASQRKYINAQIAKAEESLRVEKGVTVKEAFDEVRENIKLQV